MIMFLQHYKMGVEKILKSLAMDEVCEVACSERPIKEFGDNTCSAKCCSNAQKTLT